ncbi:hypothetical protein BuS5_02851 [Desulfosarcina sp. BuS5]|nr:hypothetical protein BuS5_02851 [Desulfosarcina sp. BuS5]
MDKRQNQSLCPVGIYPDLGLKTVISGFKTGVFYEDFCSRFVVELRGLEPLAS